MKRWARPCRRRAIRPRRARCHASCHRSSIRGTRRFAASIKMATSRGAARCLSPPRSPITPSHSKRSMTASGPSPLPRSSSGASTNAVTRFTLLPRFRGGAPPAPLAPRPTGRTKNDDDDNRRLTVTYVVGLLCYPCPRPPRPSTKQRAPRTKELLLQERMHVPSRQDVIRIRPDRHVVHVIVDVGEAVIDTGRDDDDVAAADLSCLRRLAERPWLLGPTAT